MADVILVDIFDNDIGIAEKIQAHENAMLIQQRAYTKYHSPGKWANACCSHPWRGKTLEECAMQRAKEELGIEISKPKELFDFIYFSEYDNGLCEYELDHVLIVDYDGSLSINREEINDVKWINIDDLSIDIVKYPQKYTTWFLNCVPRVIKYIKENF